MAPGTNGARRTRCASAGIAYALTSLVRFDEAKALLRRMVPVARRVLGENHNLTLKLRWIYAKALYEDTGASRAPRPRELD